MVSMPNPLNNVSNGVPLNALIRDFSITKSPSFGSTPSTGAAHQVPLTILPVSAIAVNIGALLPIPFAPFSTTNFLTQHLAVHAGPYIPQD